MQKILVTILVFFLALSTSSAQKGIDFSHNYAAGGRLLMCVDSAAQNVYYANIFPNQPNTSFNFLPDVHEVSIQIYFKQQEAPEDFRYTILVDDTPIAINASIDTAQLEDVHKGDPEIFRSTTLGVFSVKGKNVTVLVYNVNNPLEGYKSVFYGKPIPKATIKIFSKRFKTDRGVDYDRMLNPGSITEITFNEKDDELTIVRDRSNIDYLYSIYIINKRTDECIFQSTSWEYGGYIGEDENYLPYVKIDKSVFKKSGDYQIIIQPLIAWDKYEDGNISPEEFEKYISTSTLSISINQESYSKNEMLLLVFITLLIVGSVFLISLYFIRKRNKNKLIENEKQKNAAKIHLSTIRSQLNPHFLFNALSGVQNLMNKNQIDAANKYLSKFARLTRNILDDKDLVSLQQEKALLDDYLQMEQLRFSFNYTIYHSEGLDLENIEIPSMLLQPFVENAVKHGVSHKATGGLITISFLEQGKDLILSISDNGNGFNTEQVRSGLGLQLSKDRMALLNGVYKENRFKLEISSTAIGTKIILTITGWL